MSGQPVGTRAVFVDPSGRRGRTVRQVTTTLGAVLFACALLVIAALVMPVGMNRFVVPGLGPLLPGPGAPAFAGPPGADGPSSTNQPSATPSPSASDSATPRPARSFAPATPAPATGPVGSALVAPTPTQVPVPAASTGPSASAPGKPGPTDKPGNAPTARPEPASTHAATPTPRPGKG